MSFKELITTFYGKGTYQLDYADMIYDQVYSSTFHEKSESIQYIASQAITGAIRGASTERLYEELSLESVKSRRWFRKLPSRYLLVQSQQ